MRLVCVLIDLFALPRLNLRVVYITRTLICGKLFERDVPRILGSTSLNCSPL